MATLHLFTKQKRARVFLFSGATSNRRDFISESKNQHKLLAICQRYNFALFVLAQVAKIGYENPLHLDKHCTWSFLKMCATLLNFYANTQIYANFSVTARLNDAVVLQHHQYFCYFYKTNFHKKS